MSDETAREIYKSYLITIHQNNTDKDGEYRAYGRNFLGHTNSVEDEMNLPSYTLFGDDPEQLMKEVKSKYDQDFDN